MSIQTSPKGFSASKCDVGNGIFSKSQDFLVKLFGNFGIFLDSFGIFVWKFLGNFSKGFYCRNFLGTIFWEKFFGHNFFERIFRRIFSEDFFRGFFRRIFLEAFLEGIFWKEFFVYKFVCQDFGVMEENFNP